jgi:hypothetical protein
MSCLILPRRFTSQPQGAVEIDRGNVFGKDTLDAFYPGSHPASPLINTIRSTPYGPGYHPNATVASSFYLNVTPKYITKHTLLYVGLISTVGNTSAAAFSLESPSSGEWSGSGGLVGEIWSNVANYGYSNRLPAHSDYDFGYANDSGHHTVIVSVDATSASLYVDGVARGTPKTWTTPVNALYDRIRVFKKGWNTGSSLDAPPAGSYLNLGIVLGRDITAQEAADLSANPWQIFKAK